MSGKYLHGLIIDYDYIDVKDNIFSHSELRQRWTCKESKHNLIQEWSWDYVTREFVETYKELIPIAQKWIKKNISTHKQLIAWVDRNWGGLVCGDESEREFYVWQLIDEKAKCKNKLVNNFLKAYADRTKADADRAKTYADRTKADADWAKADADWKKAYAVWTKADAVWAKTGAVWTETDAVWAKACAVWTKADAVWAKTCADRAKTDADRAKTDADWAKADADRAKACADRTKAYADWTKACAVWKTRIMKPVFMELLKKYPNKHWRNK